MNINKKIISRFAIATIALFSVYACSEKEVEAPNGKEVITGSVDKLVNVSSAMDALKLSNKMSKVWDPESFLVNISGSDVGVDGINKSQFAGSKWIITYFSPTKLKSYVITMSGAGSVSWLETSGGNYTANNNISNFSVDSTKAMQVATASGLPEGKIYSMELAKNDKGMFWFIGSKKDEKASKYEVKKVDALSGNIVS
ncbi:MAG: hypothetical protein U0354_12035 [Candidatus Sericytochromatia bacterium]